MSRHDEQAPVITIDGPSGSGKGVLTHRLAAHLGFHILDSGALYRLIGLAARQRSLSLDDEAALARLAGEMDIQFVPTDDPEEPIQVVLDGVPVTRLIRTDEAGTDASRVARFPQVRNAITQLQRDFARPPGLIADGRDMGTVVFVDAPVKIYLTASAEARAQRRYKQLIDKGMSANLRDLFISIQARDDQDMNRSVAPLKPAEDALIIDSTSFSLDEVFAQVLAKINEKLDLHSQIR